MKCKIDESIEIKEKYLKQNKYSILLNLNKM